MSGDFIKRLGQPAGTQIAVTIVEGGLREARRWHHDVHLPFISKDPTRLDRSWNWPRKVAWTSALERASGRRSIFLQLNVPSAGGDAFPVGQILVSDGFPYFPRPPSGDCVFLWYLAGAPDSALRRLGLPTDLRLMRSLVDTAIQFSLLRGYDGRVALHAAKPGDPTVADVLPGTYKVGVGLAPYPKSHGRISPFRPNDGRYYHADERRAQNIAKVLDYLR